MKITVVTLLSSALLTFGIFNAGCGKQGPPEAPELSAPNVVRAFNAVGDVKGVILRWAAPVTTASGDEIADLMGFRIDRSQVVLGETPVFTPIADVDVPPPVAGIPQMNFEYRDAEVAPGKLYEYRIVPYNQDRIPAKEPRVLRVTFLGESTTVEVF